MSQLLEECRVIKGQIAEMKCRIKLIYREIEKDNTPKQVIEDQLNKVTEDFSQILAKIDCLEKDI